jgi:DNA (cytosine-5)-methyltransferase 1
MYKALSLFSGIGGFCEGVKLAGYEIVGAVEFDKYAATSYRANFPEIPLCEKDVKDFLCIDSPEHHIDFENYVKGKIDLIFGGPPCQGFSQIGPRDPFDPRNELYLQICRLAKQLNPKVVLIENVPNMLLMKGGLFKDRIVKALSIFGYSNIGVVKLCAANYGVPQSRNRIFLLAVRDDFISESAQEIIDCVSSEMFSDYLVTVDDAIMDLPEEVAKDSDLALIYPDICPNSSASKFLKEMRLDMNGVKYKSKEKILRYKLHQEKVELHNHHTKNVQSKRQRIISMLKPGAKASSLPISIWNNKRPEKWRRFDGEKPAHTLLAHMHRDMSEWIHYRFDRWITVREAMRLQGFHDGFILKTSEWQQLKQVGNAVPPFLAEVPAMAAKQVLDIGYQGVHFLPSEKQLNLF